MNLKECMNNKKDDDSPIVGLVVIFFKLRLV